MTKIGMLKKRIVRVYNDAKNWEYSRKKGYPEDTYFGYHSLGELKASTIKKYKAFYGKGLKYWNYD